ncbi:MAG: DUF2442 domain-containing protein [Dehalococcoidia bacterium]
MAFFAGIKPAGTNIRFEDASIASILNVELPQPHHLYWPDLDVDLELESLDSPERYPLVDSQGLASRST